MVSGGEARFADLRGFRLSQVTATGNASIGMQERGTSLAAAPPGESARFWFNGLRRPGADTGTRADVIRVSRPVVAATAHVARTAPARSHSAPANQGRQQRAAGTAPGGDWLRDPRQNPSKNLSRSRPNAKRYHRGAEVSQQPPLLQDFLPACAKFYDPDENRSETYCS